MFMRFISAGQPDVGVLHPETGEKALGRPWILLCPESLRVLVLFVAIPTNPPVPLLGSIHQVIPFDRRPIFTGEGFIGRDRHDGRWYRILPCPAMGETSGVA
jgi:hypothetical protein